MGFCNSQGGHPLFSSRAAHSGGVTSDPAGRIACCVFLVHGPPAHCRPTGVSPRGGALWTAREGADILARRMSQRALRHTALAALLWLAGAPAARGGAARVAPPPPPRAGDGPRVGIDCAAVGGGTVLSFEELDELLLARHGRSLEGREATQHLLRAAVLESLAREHGIEIAGEELEARRAQIEREVRRAGQGETLEEYLASQRVEPERFLRLLRLALVQEHLTRRALGVPPGDPVTAEQQEIWLDEEMKARGIEQGAYPWRDEAVARCGEAVVTREALAAELRRSLGPQPLREACYQLLLARRARERVPDLAPAQIEQAIEREIERRRREAERNPAYGGASFEQLLAAKGMDREALRGDPSIVVGALARLEIERRYDDEALRTVYLTERDTFDGLYGEAWDVDLLLLRAGRFPSELVPRTFAQAERELEQLRAEIGGRQAFRALAKARSEDRATREEGGHLGWVARLSPQVPAPVRRAVFDAVARPGLSQTTPADDPARLLGPTRTAEGCVLLWIGERRPPPSWPEMAEHVAAELRHRWVEEVLSPAEVVTFLDASATQERR